MTHPSFESLSDHVDEALPAAEDAALKEHLSHCASCRSAVDALRACTEAANHLPREVAAPEDLWNDIRATIEARKVVPHPAGATMAPRPSRRWMVAAAVALVTLSSATTAWFLRRVPGDGAPAVASIPAGWEVTEASYVASTADLARQLDAQRERLDPATVATVERALATIDAAIGEARAALARDPANAALTDLLASNYRQKVELLRRATQLASDT